LFADIPEQDLSDFAGLLRRRNIAPGEILWSEGDVARGMALVVSGRVSLTLSLPGERSIEFSAAGPGEILGEVPLIDGGAHAATARAVEPTVVLMLRPTEFAALVSRRHTTAFALKRRIAAVGTGRLRVQINALATSLADDDVPAITEAPSEPEIEFTTPPNSSYVRRLAAFHAFDSLALWGFLTAGRYARCPPGQTLVAEGAQSPACYLTINGAVEKVLVRGSRRIRIGLAGPGQAFGYESLIDGEPAPMAATTRERTLLLILPPEAFGRLFTGETDGSHEFLDVILRDLIAGLRQLLRPQARLAASK
jgi:CRP-like cAMP-binding protein